MNSEVDVYDRELQESCYQHILHVICTWKNIKSCWNNRDSGRKELAQENTFKQ